MVRVYFKSGPSLPQKWSEFTWYEFTGTLFKDRGIRLITKIIIVQTLVFPIILYGAETWTIKKADKKTIDAFELWCWRKLLGVNYLDRKINTEIIDIIKPKRMLESRIVKAALSFFGHVVRSDMNHMMELKMMWEE